MSTDRVGAAPEPGLPAEAIAGREFASARRGYDQAEVRRFLRAVADDLARVRAARDDLRSQLNDIRATPVTPTPPPPPPELTDEQVVAAVGEEMAAALRSSHAAARDLKAKAAEDAERVVAEARRRAEVLDAEARERCDAAVADAEARLAEASEEADRRLAAATADAEAQVTEAREGAARDAEQVVARARREAEELRRRAEEANRATVEAATAERDRILGDLGRRRRVATVQIEQLRAGRERLLQSYALVRETLQQVNDDLQRADAEARAAADEVGRRLHATMPPPSKSAGTGSGPGPLPEVEQVAVVDTAGPDSSGPDTAGADAADVQGADAGQVGPDEPTSDGPGPDGPEAAGTDANRTGADEGGADEGGADEGGAVTEGTVTAEPAAAEPAVAELGVDEPGVDELGVDQPGVDQPAAPGAGTAVSGKGAPTGSGGAGDVVADGARSGARTRKRSSRTAGSRTGPSGPARSAGDGPVARTEGSSALAVAAEAERIADDAGRGLEAAEDGTGAPGPGDAGIAHSDADELHLQRRDRELDTLIPGLTRRLKRALQDEHNDLLDRLRGLRQTPTLAAVLPPESEQAATLAAVVATFVADAATAGAQLAQDLGPRVAGSAGPEHRQGDDPSAAVAATAHLAPSAAFQLVGPLRRRIDAVLSDLAGEPHDAIVDALASVYREVRAQRVERLAGDTLTAAYAEAVWHAVPDGVALRWLADDVDGPCADCDDNVLAGPLVGREAYPTGQLHPPAHSGCRCLLVPDAG